MAFFTMITRDTKTFQTFFGLHQGLLSVCNTFCLSVLLMDSLYRCNSLAASRPAGLALGSFRMGLHLCSLSVSMV